MAERRSGEHGVPPARGLPGLPVPRVRPHSALLKGKYKRLVEDKLWPAEEVLASAAVLLLLRNCSGG